MARIHMAVCVLVTALLSPGAAFAQMIIEGRVKTEDGGRLPDHVRVLLLGDMYQTIADTYLDASGRFRFSTASRQCYVQLEVGGSDYESQTARIDPNPNPYTKGRETIYRDFLLRLRDNVRKERTTARPGAKMETFAQNVPKHAKEEFDKGAASLEKQDRAAAVASFRRALEVFPDYYDALEALGTEQAREKNYDEAIPLLRRAVLVNDKGWKTHYSLGVALAETKQREEAIAELRRALELNPQSANTSMRLGLELAKDPRTYPDAIKAFVAVTHTAGKSLPDAYFYLASLYSKQKQYKEAADALEAYLAASPNADEAQRAQYQKAIQQLRAKAGSPQ